MPLLTFEPYLNTTLNEFLIEYSYIFYFSLAVTTNKMLNLSEQPQDIQFMRTSL